MTLLRGRRDGLEVALSNATSRRPVTSWSSPRRAAEFLRGSSAVANFGAARPRRKRWRGCAPCWTGRHRPAGALRHRRRPRSAGQGEGLASKPPAARELERRPRAATAARFALSDSARSLVADFAGARTDIAQRRKRGEASVPRLKAEPTRSAARARAAPRRGGARPRSIMRPRCAAAKCCTTTATSSSSATSIPGAELIATGDIVVFGRLAGIAHAGAQGRRAGAHLTRSISPRRSCASRPSSPPMQERKRRARPCPKRRSRATAASSILPLDRSNQLEAHGSIVA